jgi:hypothetical protein
MSNIPPQHTHTENKRKLISVAATEEEEKTGEPCNNNNNNTSSTALWKQTQNKMPRTKDTRTQTKQNTQNGFTKDGFSLCFFSSKILQLVLLLLFVLTPRSGPPSPRIPTLFCSQTPATYSQYKREREREKREKALGKPAPRTETQRKGKQGNRQNPHAERPRQ